MIGIKYYSSFLLRRSINHAVNLINKPRSTHSIVSNGTIPSRMTAWTIYYYGDNQQFTLSDSVQMPILRSPKDVLIKIVASSLNPIDIRRRGNVRYKQFPFLYMLCFV